jgi:hypothetical protein
MAMKKSDVVKYVKDNEDAALERVSQILDKETNLQSFNGIIGGKNATYDVEPLEYDTPESYIEAWMLSHQKRYDDEKHFPYPKSSRRVYNLLQNNFVKEFIENYLARTYYKKHGK